VSVHDLVESAQDEGGHAAPLLGSLLAAVGGIVLGIGAARDAGTAAVIGGILLAVGVVAETLLQHVFVEYGIFRRLDRS
jgi:hypothetical protein